MLNEMRSTQHSIFAKIALGVICLSFVVWGIDDIIRNPDRNQTLARVGSTKISTDQFMRSMHTETENIRRLMGDNFSPEAIKNMNVEGYVLQNLVNRRLLQLESQNLGLIPSDVDVVRRIRSNPAFQDSRGNFDKAIFESMLHNINMGEKAYVDQLREDMGINILLETLGSAMPNIEAAAPTLLATREEGRQVSLYALTDSAVSSVPTPDDEALKTYYDTHPREFTAPELREFSYITISAADLPKEATANEDALRAAYNERIDDFKQPERREVQQLLYSSEAQAKKALDSIKAGKSLAETAEIIEPLNKSSLAMGKIEKQNIFDAAADSVFSLKEGETSEPIQSPFGWHVFRVSKIEAPATTPFEQARPVLEKELQQRISDEALNTLANKLEDALAGGSSLQEVATEFKLKLQTGGPIIADGMDNNGKKVALPALDKFLETVFKTEEKTESPVMTSKGGVFYIVRVDSVTPEHLRPLADVKQLAVKGWQKQERDKKLAEIATKLSKDFAGAGNKAALISSNKLQSLGDSTIKRSTHVAKDTSLPPQLVSDVFSRKVGEGTAAYLSNNGNYLLAVSNAVVPMGNVEKDPRLQASQAEISRNLQNVRQNELMDEYTSYLRGKYSVSIYEDVFHAVTN